MADAAVKTVDAADEELTDGFNLIIDGLKLNGLDTIYGVPGARPQAGAITPFSASRAAGSSHPG
jgi:hypothetical protein